jgi:hypothetical protein
VTLVPASSRGSGGGSGTVTSVGSADSSVTVTNPTTTPDLSVSYSHITGAPAQLAPTAVKVANYNAVAADYVVCDVTGGAFTVTLPTAPADKTQIAVEIVAQTTTGAPKLLTVAAGGSDVFYVAAGATSILMGQPFVTVVFQYKASGAIWYAPGAGASLPSGFEFGYDPIVANVPITSSTEATGTTIISCAAHGFDGAPVLATFFSSGVFAGVAGVMSLSLFESTTEQGVFVYTQGVSGAQPGGAMLGCLRFTPSAASHTYTVTGFRTVANGVVQAGAGGTATNVPAYIRFTKV